MNFNWKILDVVAVDGLITKAKYNVTAQKNENEHEYLSENNLNVSTEGNWLFRELNLNVPFHDVTEKMVIDWIKSESTIDGINVIEKRLLEQLENLENKEKNVLPWGPKVFTLNIED